MKKIAYAAALLAATTPVLIGCANTDADKKATDTAKNKAAPMICLHRRDIDGWNMRDDGKMVVSGLFRNKYLLSLAGWCHDFDFSMGVRFDSPGHVHTMCLDSGDYVIPVGNPTAVPGARCYITKIEPYTKQMQADYKKLRDAVKAAKAKDKADKAAAKADKAN